MSINILAIITPGIFIFFIIERISNIKMFSENAIREK
jgi:hypothetical protein